MKWNNFSFPGRFIGLARRYIFRRHRSVLALAENAATFFTRLIGLPNLAGIILTNARLYGNTYRLLERKRLARTFAAPARDNLAIPVDTGYLQFDAAACPRLRPALASCEKIVAEKGADGIPSIFERESRTKSKGHFFNFIKEEDLIAHPDLMDFALSDEILAAVIPYYGFVPRLSSIGLYYSTVTDDLVGSQKFHLDGIDPHHVKCFVNVSHVGPDDGPFTFIPADRTGELIDHGGGPLRSGGTEDAALLERYEAQYGIALTGGTGTAAFVDTARCLHYGSRCRQNPRIVFMFHYAVFGNYTDLDVNPLRDIRIQHYSRLRKTFATDDLRRCALHVD